jgi:hypothetical protein
MNQTIFDVPDSLIVHAAPHALVLCIIISASLILGILNVTKHKNDNSPSLINCGRLVLADA